MKKVKWTGRITALLLAAAMVLVLCVPARAGELTEPLTEATEAAEPETTPAPAETEASETLTEAPVETAPPAEAVSGDTEEETRPMETEPEEGEQAETEPTEALREAPEPLAVLPSRLGVTPYFGLLHAHTDLSDGQGTVEEAFAGASAVEGLDFFAVTDHSNSFDNASQGAIDLDGAAVSADWARGKEAALAVTGETFVGLFGYEMTWQEDRGLGHINTFNTPGWQSRNQKEFRSLEAYYDALTTVPGSVSQFNHPGPEYGAFEDFGHWTAQRDEAMALLEVGGEGGFAAYDSYTRALDAGWHVAPTISQNNHNGSWGREGEGRTVVLAEALNEDSLYEAMSRRRVYATEDRDLTLVYTLGGQLMGSVVPSADSHEIRLWASDPSGEAVGCVEVVGEGDRTIRSVQLEEAAGEVTLSVPGGERYYFLRITQGDGDVAVTAPVWTEGYDDVGILFLESDKQVPVQGESITLTLAIYNEEMLPFRVEQTEFFVDGESFAVLEDPQILETGEILERKADFTHFGLGTTVFRVRVTGTIAGKQHRLEETLTLRYRSEEMVGDILVDGSHSSLDSGQLDNLRQLAETANMEVSVFDFGLPGKGKLLILPPPEAGFSQSFLEAAGEFLRQGGCLVVCGSSRVPGASEELNRLLEAVGATIRLREDEAVDEVNNGGDPGDLYPTEYNRDSDWGRKLSRDQFYIHRQGCTLDPGDSIWLVRGFSTTVSSQTGETRPVVLAAEFPESGGTVLAAGCPFLWDDNMPLPENKWDPPRANQTILEILLGLEEAKLELDAIADVRRGETGKVYRVKGYATSGTSNVHTTFPETVYIQDDTGGIPLVPFTEPGLQIGAPVEAVGYLDIREGNPVLELIDVRLPQEAYYRHVPRPQSNSRAMNYKINGGKLVQVEAEVTAVTLTDDGKGVRRFTLKDEWGAEAVVLIEESIRSGASGRNELAETVRIGRTVRAMGLLHLDENGIPVVRVRNCDEVVYVPPLSRPNPYTGDRIGQTAALGILSLTAALWLLVRRRRGNV